MYVYYKKCNKNNNNIQYYSVYIKLLSARMMQDKLIKHNDDLESKPAICVLAII